MISYIPWKAATAPTCSDSSCTLCCQIPPSSFSLWTYWSRSAWSCWSDSVSCSRFQKEKESRCQAAWKKMLLRLCCQACHKGLDSRGSFSATLWLLPEQSVLLSLLSPPVPFAAAEWHLGSQADLQTSRRIEQMVIKHSFHPISAPLLPDSAAP